MTGALAADAIAAVADLELAARLVVEGLRAGAHRSPYRGPGAEFSEHRAYRAGDDLKRLDWKLLARTDRLYTRQYLDTTNLNALIVLDTSRSMAFPEHGVSKFRYAQVLAAALAYLVVKQGDSAGLLLGGADAASYVPARGGRPHLHRLIARIEAARPGGAWRAEAALDRAGERLGRRGVIVVVSDFYDAEDATFAALARLAAAGQDVAMFQLLSAPELEFPFTGVLEFEDVESGERRVLDARAAAATYRSELDAFLDRCRGRAVDAGIDYLRASTAEPPTELLRRYLLARRAAAGV